MSRGDLEGANRDRSKAASSPVGEPVRSSLYDPSCPGTSCSNHVAEQNLNPDPDTVHLVTRVVLWGTYDLGKPRNRILIEGLRLTGVEVIECHADVWSGVEDKGALTGTLQWLSRLTRWLLAYPSLILRYLRLPRHDAVIVGYLGQLDVLVLWPFARLRGTPIVWDAFLSLYDTVAMDRRIVGPRHPVALFLLAWEWLACRAADLVVLDTRAHAEFFRNRFGLRRNKTANVFVGAESGKFRTATADVAAVKSETDISVLFYGQFIPLHGIDTIVRAAQMAKGRRIRWTLIGRGQEEHRIRDMLGASWPPNFEWIPWVPYDELAGRIHAADICLGIFGDTDKAARVIPNKVFQILSAGKPLVTRDSPAIRELLDDKMPGIYLVPPVDPKALLDALEKFSSECGNPGDPTTGVPLHRALIERFSTKTIGEGLREMIADLQTRRRPASIPKD